MTACTFRQNVQSPSSFYLMPSRNCLFAGLGHATEKAFSGILEPRPTKMSAIGVK